MPKQMDLMIFVAIAASLCNHVIVKCKSGPAQYKHPLLIGACMKSFKETAIIARLNQCFNNHSCQSNKQKTQKGSRDRNKSKEASS